MRKLIKNSSPLVEDGVFNFGTYSHPLKSVNPLDANISKFPTIKPYKFMRLKEWHAYQMGNHRFFIFIALMNIKKVGCVIIDIFDKETKEQYRFEKNVPAWTLKLSPNLTNSQATCSGKGFKIKINHKLIYNKIELHFFINDEDSGQINGHFTALAENFEPIVSCIPFNQRRGMYSHKCNCPIEGSLFLRGQSFLFEKEHSFFIIDDQKGYYPYVMKWDWCTASNYNQRGELIGFNLTRNQSINQDEYNENCLWLNGKLHLLPPVFFEKHENYWLIKDHNQTINLLFNITVKNNINVNALIVATHYQGPYGTFNGYIKDSLGNSIKIDNMFGMGELFYIRC